MKIASCDCRAAHYQRVKRSPWMKVVVGRRLYHCHACDQFMLLHPSDVQLRVRKEQRHDASMLQSREVAFGRPAAATAAGLHRS
jgi:hypothetical protein